jgi:dynein intermediate chain 1
MWTLIQNEMKVTEICQLPAGIVALDYFNEHSTHFRVACDDGKIYNVLRTRTTQPPTFSDAHSPPILGLSYNRFQSAVFASCGTDWAVKIWREGETGPLQVYDYAPHYATDCQFAPHSSTILGSVTSDGELFIYDIAVNRYREICKTEVVESGDGGLTALRFHPKWPVLLLGDEKGRVHAVKMSPNLRRNTKTIKDEEARNKLSKSSSRDSRGLLPDLANQQDDEDDAANAAAEEEARLEALSADESSKFIQAMGVSWIHRPDVVSAIPAA